MSHSPDHQKRLIDLLQRTRVSIEKAIKSYNQMARLVAGPKSELEIGILVKRKGTRVKRKGRTVKRPNPVRRG